MKLINLVGMMFGRLTVIKRVADRGTRVHWACKCSCGTKEVIVARNHLRSGHTTSCGCLHKEVTGSLNVSHNKSGSRVYNAWHRMHARCENQSDPKYRDYGGRGIAVCERWTKFEHFYADMGDPPIGKTLDRFPNNDGNYEPSNCRWATPKEQAMNRRPRITTVYTEMNGVKIRVADLVSPIGIDYETLAKRIKRGWPASEAIALPRYARLAKPRRKRAPTESTHI